MKRYTDTEKWESRYFSELTPFGKLAYQYITDRCNGIGVWKGNWRLLAFNIGFNGDINEIKKDLLVCSLDKFNGSQKFIILPDEKILVVNFLKFQFPKGLASKKPMVLGAMSMAKESEEIFKILVKINGEEFFCESNKSGSLDDKRESSLLDTEDCEELESENEQTEVDEKTSVLLKESKPKKTALVQGLEIISSKFLLGECDLVVVAFKEYLAKRVKMKSAMTMRGVNTLLNKLEGLSSKEWVESLNDATDNSWKSVYPKSKREVKKMGHPGIMFEENLEKDLSLDL